MRRLLEFSDDQEGERSSSKKLVVHNSLAIEWEEWLCYYFPRHVGRGSGQWRIKSVNAHSKPTELLETNSSG